MTTIPIASSQADPLARIQRDNARPNRIIGRPTSAPATAERRAGSSSRSFSNRTSHGVRPAPAIATSARPAVIRSGMVTVAIAARMIAPTKTGAISTQLGVI